MVNEFRKLKEKTTGSKTLFITAGSEENLSQLPALLNVFEKTSLNVKSYVFPHTAHMETAVITFKRAIKEK
jgi:hypothetical protein